MDWLLLVLGLGLLLVGGELLVRGASQLALRFRVSPTVVGLTIVAAGTSMPELVVSLQAAWVGSPALAMGNIVGSNIFNILAILGLCSLVSPMQVTGSSVRLEWPVMALSAFQLHLLTRDGVLDRLEGGFLLGGAVAFVAYTVWIARTGADETLNAQSEESFGDSQRSGMTSALLILGGIALLALGSRFFVQGGSGVARVFGLSEAVIGVTLVAAGTSAPELVTSLVAATRGKAELAITNVLGSNILNVLLIGGATSLIHPVPAPSEIVGRDNWWMLGASLLLFPFLRSDMRLSRFEGAVLSLGFLAYWGSLFYRI